MSRLRRFRGLLSRRYLALGLLAGLATLSVFLLLDRVIQSGDAEAHGTTVVGIDMVPDDDGDTVADNTATTLGTIDACVEVPDALSATFDIDAFINAVPAGQDLDGFGYPLNFAGTDNDGDSLVDEDPAGGGNTDGDGQTDEDGPENPPPVQLTAFDNTIIIQATDLSEGVPDKTSPHGESIDLGAVAAAPAGAAGALARYTFTTGVDTNADTTVDTAAADGVYFFTIDYLTAGGGLVNFLNTSGADWGPFDLDLITSFHDANHDVTNDFGKLALGTASCADLKPVPSPTPTRTPTPVPTPTRTPTPTPTVTPTPTPTPTVTPTPTPTPIPPPTCGGVPATIFGTNGPNVLLGSDGPDVIVGLAGNDIIRGFGGNDLICGGRGVDMILSDSGSDTVLAGSGSDIVVGAAGDDLLVGGSGDDAIDGGTDNDTCIGGPHVAGDTAVNCEVVVGVP